MEYKSTSGKPWACRISLSAANTLRLKKVFAIYLAFVVSGCEHTLISQPPASAQPAGKVSAVGASAEDEYFQIAVIPDTQYYTALKHGGTMTMFQDQISWIRSNRLSSKIAYVVHLGDVVDHGDDNNATEWLRAKTELYKLEQDGIPYGVAVGNHDQSPLGNPASPGTNDGYGLYFGRDHMDNNPWYGGAYGSSNNSDNHYDLFSANGVNYIVLYIEYNTPGSEGYSASIESAVMNWAEGVLDTYASRKAIIVSHSILNKPAGSNSNIKAGEGNNSVASEFTNQGEVIYDRMKLHPNVFLMLSGHISGEGFRRDTFNGKVIKSYLCDYQSRENAPFDGSSRNGGNGLMRLMKFNKTQQTLGIRTFAPRVGANILEVDQDSDFTTSLYN